MESNALIKNIPQELENIIEQLFGKYSRPNIISPLLMKTLVGSVISSTEIKTVMEALTGVPENGYPPIEELLKDRPFASKLTNYGLVYKFLGNNETGNQLLHIAKRIFNKGLKDGFGERDKRYSEAFYFTDASLIPKKLKKFGYRSGLPSIFLKGDERLKYKAKFYLDMIKTANNFFENNLETPT